MTPGTTLASWDHLPEDEVRPLSSGIPEWVGRGFGLENSGLGSDSLLEVSEYSFGKRTH